MNGGDKVYCGYCFVEYDGVKLGINVDSFRFDLIKHVFCCFSKLRHLWGKMMRQNV